jgi:hypothetical protein
VAALPMVSGYDRAAAAGRSTRGTLGRVTSAEDIGEWTPAPAPTRHTAAVLRLEPGQLAMVAVHTWDMHGAARAALTAAWASCLGGAYRRRSTRRTFPVATASRSSRVSGH